MSEKPERKSSRRALLRTLAGVSAVGCGQAPENAPRARAQAFMRDYYERHDAQAALAYTQGEARERLDKEIDLAGKQRPTEIPNLIVTFRSSRDEEGGGQTFVFDVAIQPRGAQEFRRVAAVTVAEASGGWVVSAFTES